MTRKPVAYRLHDLRLHVPSLEKTRTKFPPGDRWGIASHVIWNVACEQVWQILTNDIYYRDGYIVINVWNE